jgi:hypothetical protein
MGGTKKVNRFMTAGYFQLFKQSTRGRVCNMYQHRNKCGAQLEVCVRLINCLQSTHYCGMNTTVLLIHRA